MREALFIRARKVIRRAPARACRNFFSVSPVDERAIDIGTYRRVFATDGIGIRGVICAEVAFFALFGTRRDTHGITPETDSGTAG